MKLQRINIVVYLALFVLAIVVGYTRRDGNPVSKPFPPPAVPRWGITRAARQCFQQCSGGITNESS
jgi:hypothetical protein